MSAIFRGLPRAAVRAAAPLSRSAAATTFAAAPAASFFAAARPSFLAAAPVVARAAPVWVPRQHFVPPHGGGKIPARDAEAAPVPVLNNASASESGAGDGSEFFTESDLAVLGLGRVLPSEVDNILRDIRRTLPKHSVPSFAASFPVDIHPTLRAKVSSVVDYFESYNDFMLLLAAAARCRDVALCTALITRAQSKGLQIKFAALEHLIDTALYRRDDALLATAAALPVAASTTGKAAMASATVAFLQRSGKVEEAFRYYAAAVAEGTLRKPWRSVYATTVPKLARRVATYSSVPTEEEDIDAAEAAAAAADAAADAEGGKRDPIHCVTLHERHPEANFAAWRYAMRALRGDMRLTFPGEDIRVPGNLVIDIGTQGMRGDALDVPGGAAVLRRRWNMVLGFVRVSGRQAATSLRRYPSLFYIPRDAVEGVVTSERHLLPSERAAAAPAAGDNGAGLIGGVVEAAAMSAAMSSINDEAAVEEEEEEEEDDDDE